MNWSTDTMFDYSKFHAFFTFLDNVRNKLLIYTENYVFVKWLVEIQLWRQIFLNFFEVSISTSWKKATMHNYISCVTIFLHFQASRYKF